MRNMIFRAQFINKIDEGNITIYYYGKISIYINEFFPCADSRLRKLLKEYREPLAGEYTALCWSLYHWLEDLSKYCGARGKAYGNRVLKNMDVLAKEVGIK